MGFCTAINCMDGRVQLPVIRFLQERFGADYVDCITEPRPVRIFDKGVNLMTLNSIYTRINVSVHQHHSRAIAICAHADCAGNPVDDETQERQLQRAIIFLKESYQDTDVVALWVDENQNVCEIAPWQKTASPSLRHSTR
ncbi:MAG: hypothetical protein ISS71_08180 [Phycisphaerae bacterium]|nr:hypothetical protein [Phycisphaerae bacterium]